MNFKKLSVSSFSLLLSSSILLAGSAIAKKIDSSDVFSLADAVSWIGFAFLVFGLVLMIISLFKKEN